MGIIENRSDFMYSCRMNKSIVAALVVIVLAADGGGAARAKPIGGGGPGDSSGCVHCVASAQLGGWAYGCPGGYLFGANSCDIDPIPSGAYLNTCHEIGSCTGGLPWPWLTAY